MTLLCCGFSRLLANSMHIYNEMQLPIKLNSVSRARALPRVVFAQTKQSDLIIIICSLCLNNKHIPIITAIHTRRRAHTHNHSTYTHTRMRELALGCDLNLNKCWTHKHTQHPPANTHTVIIYELFISWMHCCAVSVCVCAYVCTCVCVSGVPGYTPDQHACIKVRGYALNTTPD